MASPPAAPPAYREVDGYTLIELRLRTLAQLFNSLDPAPFHERDLDTDAVEYVREAMEELRGKSPLKIRIELQEPLASDTAWQVTDAIRNFFAFRARKGRMLLKQQLRIGRFSLVVGLAFMASCLEIRSLLPEVGGAAKVVREGLSIMGWVAMWKPLDIFLYAWWPILAEIRRDERIAELPVEVVGAARAGLGPSHEAAAAGGTEIPRGGPALDSPGGEG